MGLRDAGWSWRRRLDDCGQKWQLITHSLVNHQQLCLAIDIVVFQAENARLLSNCPNCVPAAGKQNKASNYATKTDSQISNFLMLTFQR